MKKIIIDWIIKYRIHIIIWGAYIAYETILLWVLFGAGGRLSLYVVHYSLLLLLFYSQAKYFLPWAVKFPKRSYWGVPLILTVEMIVFVLLSFAGDEMLFYFHLIPPSKTYGFNPDFYLKTIYRGVQIMFFSTGYYFVLRYNAEKRRAEELERIRLNNIIQQQKSEQELIKAQNAYLKAQINPHFLFNTLDFIYHNIVKLSPSIGEAVVTLADMMRYAIDSDRMGDFIPLNSEIEQVENFLYLNRIRKKDGLHVKFTYVDNVLDIKFIPLVLLTLTENIFKHGDLSQAETSALINVYIKEQMFYIETDNLIDKKNKPESSHTGLANIHKRLEYAYDSGAAFTYHEDNRGHFVTSIAIPLALLKG